MTPPQIEQSSGLTPREHVEHAIRTRMDASLTFSVHEGPYEVIVWTELDGKQYVEMVPFFEFDMARGEGVAFDHLINLIRKINDGEHIGS